MGNTSSMHLLMEVKHTGAKPLEECRRETLKLDFRFNSPKTKVTSFGVWLAGNSSGKITNSRHRISKVSSSQSGIHQNGKTFPVLLWQIAHRARPTAAFCQDFQDPSRKLSKLLGACTLEELSQGMLLGRPRLGAHPPFLCALDTLETSHTCGCYWITAWLSKTLITVARFGKLSTRSPFGIWGGLDAPPAHSLNRPSLLGSLVSSWTCKQRREENGRFSSGSR